jgi:dsRNA-specific ribonuclease
VLLNDEPIGTGSGSSKKEAEQAAARTALEDRKP